MLERSYEENERKIRGLIQELSGERHALVNTSDRVTESLQRLGGEIPALIEKLSDQQVKLAKVIEGAGENLTSLETSLATSVGSLETAVGGRTEQLQNVLENYTSALGTALGSRAEQLQITFDDQLQQLDTSLGNRTENLQTVFEEYARALDAALANRAQALDYQLVERTRSLDEAFAERLRLFDEFDHALHRGHRHAPSSTRPQALTSALDAHAVSFRETIGKQATDLDEALMHGINSVRRASENITRQSIKAMEGLAGQSEMLKNISENLLEPDQRRHRPLREPGPADHEGRQRAGDGQLQDRQDAAEPPRRAGAARSTGCPARPTSSPPSSRATPSSIEGSLSDADLRARSELERMRAHTTRRERAHAGRSAPPADPRCRATMTTELGTLTNRFAATSEEMRQQAARAAAEIAAEQAPPAQQMERLPVAAQESSESMRRALQDQIKALDQLSQLTARAAVQRDVTPPAAQRRDAAATAAACRRAARAGARPARSPRCPRPSRRSSATGSASAARRPSSPPTAAKAGRSAICWRAPRATRTAQRTGGGARQPAAAFNLDLEAIARALDPATAAAIWSRLRAGQRGVMVRSIYGNEGRTLFDDVSQRCRADAELGAHRQPLSRRLRAHHLRIRHARSLRAPDAGPARLRHGPRLSLPRPRLRPPRLRPRSLAPIGMTPCRTAKPCSIEAAARAWPLAEPVRHRPRRQDRSARRRRARRRRRPRPAAARRCPTRATARRSRRRLAALRALAGPARPRRACRTCCRAGAARNALDCALWDLEAKQAGQARLGARRACPSPAPVLTCYTLSLGDARRRWRRRHAPCRT